jgi:hypothetical protein
MMPDVRRPKRAALLLSVVLLTIASLSGFAIAAQNFTPKSLQGKVLNSAEKPISGAIVYLQNSKSSDVKTFISTDDGSYRFGQIAGDTDYTVWAAWKDKKSPTKAISSFDSRKSVTIDLHIKTE